MKSTTCVRVVLPTDELVRVECAASMTVADLVRTLEKRSNLRKSNGITRNGGGGYASCTGDNNCDADPTTDTSFLWRSKGDASAHAYGKLTLVRLESELKVGSLVADEVDELDILEFQLSSASTSEWLAELNCQQTRGKLLAKSRSSLHKVVEEVRPVSTASLSPLSQRTQNGDVREEMTAHNGASGSLTPLSRGDHSEVKLKDVLRNLRAWRSALRRRGGRAYPVWQNKRRRLLFTRFQELRQNSKMRKNAERILLQAGMQLIDRMQLLQKDVRALVFLLRDAILGKSGLRSDDLLILVGAMVKTLTRTSLGSSDATSSASEDAKDNAVRRLSWDIAGRDGGVVVVLEGWVVTAEWGTFWRSQREEYACLCDNHMLYFFSSRTHCADFVFELGRERDGSVSETSKRLLKDNSPLSQIDLSETDWTVRKSSEDSATQHRNAFAFFDPMGKMRLVLDVSTASEAITWARLIAAEINQNKMFARMRELSSSPEDDTEANSSPLATWMEVMAQLSGPGDQQPLILPLRSLYSQIDRLNGTARAERYKSWTLSQALKDLQRDRVEINGLALAGASLEATILALTLEILRCTEAEEENAATKANSGETITSVSTASKEMTALRFARQVIICSSRTHGGGDILDTLHLLFGNERFVICPDARSMDPIKIGISQKASDRTSLSAQITMKMTYRVIPTTSIGPVDDQTFASRADVSRCSDHEFQDGNGEQQQTREFKILGTYTQRLHCHFVEANDIEGSVQLESAG